MNPRFVGFFATLAARPGERDVLLASRRRMAIFAVLGALVFLSSNVLAQFTPLTVSNLPKVVESASAWGDYDNDGYLDLLISGSTDSANADPIDLSKNVTKLFHNNGDGTFTEVNAGLARLCVSTVAWGDYDNDGYLDILMGGADTSNTQVTKLYHNNGGNGTFTGVALPNVHSSSYGCVAWGDYNNDGYLDILVSAFDVAGPITKLYRNNSGNGTFTEVTTAVFTGVNGHSKVVWGDYDNDGFLDVLLCGRTTTSTTSPQPVTKLYHNNGDGTFTADTSVNLAGVWAGAVAFADFNNDGYLDIFITGQTTGVDNPQDTTVFFENNGNGTFTGHQPGIGGTRGSSVSLGDYDGDGLVDVLMSGYGCNTGRFRNLGNFAFSTQALFPNEFASGSVAWGDINGDGYLDAIVSGVVVGTNRDTVIVYRNSGSGTSASYFANVKPGAPTNLVSSVSAGSVTLGWGKSTDGGAHPTPQDGLSYNLRMGTSPRGINRISPLADTASGAGNGFRRVVRSGSVAQTPSWTVKTLPAGKYYWSVQAIDNAFAGSVFSTQAFFALPYTITASAGPNGTITPSGSVSVMPDSSKKFSIIPASNYRVDSLIVDGVRIPSDTAYTFSAVAANHTIRAKFTPITKLVSIAEARKDLDHNGIPDHLGDTLAVVGIVNSVNIQTTNFGYFIQDSSAGIHVFKTGLTGAPALRPGYRVAVSGKIDYYRGTTEIVPFDLASDIVVIDTGNAITAIPLSITSYKANPEAYESRRIVLDVVQPAGFTSAQWPAAGASANLNVWNGKDSLVLRIDGDTEVDGSPYPSFPARVTGVATQFTSSTTINDDGYQITPMFISDFVAVNAPPIRFFGLLLPANGSRLLVDTVGTRQYKFKWHPSIDFNNNRLAYTFQPVGLSGLPSDSSGVDTVKTLTGAALRAYVGAADSLIFKWTVLVKDSLNPAVACIDTFSVVLKKVLVGVNDAPSGIPAAFALAQNYPNPFNPSTTIRYALPQRAHVSLSVYNALGQNISELVNGEEESGYHEVRFDAANLASGVYFYRIQAGSFVETKKLMLLR